MPSTQQDSEEHALDDDAVLALLAFAEWDVKFDKEEEVWLVKPPATSSNDLRLYVCFMSLRDAGEYFLMRQRLKSD